MRKIIIVGGDHHNTLALIRAFGQEDFYVIVFVVSESRKSFVIHSKYVGEYHVVCDEKSVVDELLSKDFGVNGRIPVITSSDKSAEVLDRYYDVLGEKYILSNCAAKQGGISFWMDKQNMHTAARECGLLQPFSLFIPPHTDVENELDNFPFQCIVKPAKSSVATKDDFRICNSIEELDCVLHDMSNRGISMIVQEYIKVDYEFLIIGARCRETEKNHILGGLHKHKCCKDTNNMGMFVTAETTPDLPQGIVKSKIDSFLDLIDYEGLYSIEFLISGDKAYFTEINLRNDGCLFCWTNAGCNIAVNWANEMLTGAESVYNKLQRKNMLVEISYFKYYGKKILTLIKEFRKADAFAIFDKNDVKPFVFKFLNVIRL